MKNVNKVFLIRGNVGTGKTSLAEIITQFSDNSFAVAADDYPGLYDGEFSRDKQSAAHQWCLDCFKKAIQVETPIVVVHNTFIDDAYLLPYLQAVQEWNQNNPENAYSVQVIQTEAVINPDGSYADSVHNVPIEVKESFRDTWKPFIKPKELGITTN